MNPLFKKGQWLIVLMLIVFLLQSNIRQDMTQNLVANAEYMKSSSESIVVEGNCDELPAKASAEVAALP